MACKCAFGCIADLCFEVPDPANEMHTETSFFCTSSPWLDRCFFAQGAEPDPLSFPSVPRGEEIAIIPKPIY